MTIDHIVHNYNYTQCVEELDQICQAAKVGKSIKEITGEGMQTVVNYTNKYNKHKGYTGIRFKTNKETKYKCHLQN